MTIPINNIKKINKTWDMMGTHIYATIYNTEDEKILEDIDSLLKKYNLIFSMYDENAELYKLNEINKNETFYPSEDLYKLILMGYEHSTEEGNLNIFISPLVKLWNIGFDDRKVPTDIEIHKALENINPKSFYISDKYIEFLEDNMCIDLGALAKGYICDKIIEYLINSNVDSAIINLGGNIRTIGNAYHNPDYKFHIGLQNPNKERGEHLLYLGVKNMSIVTSGIYERNFEENGEFYHHILDPNNGYPIDSDMLSLTIISKNSIDGEIWTTRLFGFSFDKIMDFSEKYEFEAIAIYKDNVRFTKNIKNYLI